MAWKCPKCGSDELEVSVKVWATLAQDEEDEDDFQADVDTSEDGSHEWGGKSPMRCTESECRYVGKASAFELVEPPCRTCGASTDDGEGFDGECGSCADKRCLDCGALPEDGEEHDGDGHCAKYAEKEAKK